MLRFIDIEAEEETLVAGIKPLPLNRMSKQAGREANSFYTTGSYGGFVRGRDGKILRNSDGTPQRKSRRSGPDRYKGEGDKLPPEVKGRVLERFRRTQEAVENWDPVEASAQEDYNRLKGVDPSAVIELIQPIAPLDGDIRPAGMPTL